MAKAAKNKNKEDLQPVLTIDYRCGSCGWYMTKETPNQLFCENQDCSMLHVVLAPDPIKAIKVGTKPRK